MNVSRRKDLEALAGEAAFLFDATTELMLKRKIGWLHSTAEATVLHLAVSLVVAALGRPKPGPVLGEEES